VKKKTTWEIFLSVSFARSTENTALSTIDILVELLDKLVPLLVSQAGKLLEPLLVRSTALFDNSTLLRLLNTLAASEIDTASKESLVVSVRQILERPLPPALINMQSWLCNGSTLTDAFYAGSLTEKLLDIFDPKEGEEENENEPDKQQALSLLPTLAHRLEDKSNIAGLQSAFFAHPIALKTTYELLSLRLQILPFW
jgi:predicted nucleotidyltransferase